MDLANLINHPEQLDRETLYDLRGLLALYPYYQTARLLLLQNLFLLHDPSFNDELRNAALYITDRRVIFSLVEAGHYQIANSQTRNGEENGENGKSNESQDQNKSDRTITLIDDFLDSIPEEESSDEKKPKRKPTPADATVDYVSYLLETENEEDSDGTDTKDEKKSKDNGDRTISLIDDFIKNEGGKIQLKDEPEYTPEINEGMTQAENDSNEGYFTETLAKIYVKQGRYEKALEIIQRLNLNYPKKNAYFADQMRFLEKLILNNKNNKNK